MKLLPWLLALPLAAQSQFYPVAPCRLVDTRGAAAGFIGVAPFNGPSIPPQGTIAIPVEGASQTTAPSPCSAIPETATAYALNLTVVPSGATATTAGAQVDYVTIWPAGQPQPTVATLDDPQGAIVSNAAIVAAGSPSGGIDIYNAGPGVADVVIDLNGYFRSPGPMNDDPGVVQNGAVFTLSQTPNPPGSLKVYVNGLRMKAMNAAGVGDFTLSGNVVTFASLSAPGACDSLIFDYTY